MLTTPPLTTPPSTAPQPTTPSTTTSPTVPSNPPARLVSLDAYRGFVMLAMASSGLALATVAKDADVIGRWDGTQFEFAWRGLWRFLAHQFDHVAWTGCGFWDLIQPSFMFMVGVALPYSYARRQTLGHSAWRNWGHVLFRAGILVLLGVFLSSNGSSETNYTFVNVLTQIGLGYPLLYLLVGRGKVLQLTAAAVILGGYWLLFYLHPVPVDFDYAKVGVPADWAHHFTGVGAHWNMNSNFAAWFDREWLGTGFLNFFPRSEPFVFNKGGYATLNFIPSLATMLFGLMTGEMLRSALTTPRAKLLRMFLAGAACLLIGLGLDGSIWPEPFHFEWSFAPIVKRIWTPSWAVFSTGWTLWMLAAFYWVIDIKGWKAWSLPLIVVGMNSIAMYVMAQLLKPWIRDTLKTHLGQKIFEGRIGRLAYDAHFGPIVQQVSILLVLWLFCLWLYRQKIFVRI